MKSKLLNLLLVILLLVTIPGAMVLASDITGALYRMGITVSNNGTLANYVSTTGNISTPNLIAGNYSNAAVDNVAVQDAGGSDVIFMPGHTTNPWCFWVETIGADAYVNYNLYIATSTGGTIAYFPDTTGMIVSDNSTLELGSDFEIETLGWVDTVVSANKSLVYKEDAFRTYISANSSITSEIASWEDTEQLAPDGVGSETNLGLFGAATNWQANLTNDGDTSYVTVGFAVAPKRDLYSTTDSAITETWRIIDNVTVYNVSKWFTSVAGATSRTALRTNGFTYDGNVENLTDTYATYSTVYVDNPQTTDPWTWAEVDAMEIGVSLDKTIADSSRCTQVYAVVTYDYLEVSATATGIASGEYTVKTYGVANEPQWATGDVLHFDGTVNSLINCGAIYNGQAKWWISFWLKPDSDLGLGAPISWIFGKDNAPQVLYIYYANGDIVARHVTALAVDLYLVYAIDLTAGNWYHVLLSVSDVAGHRFIINNGTAETNVNLEAMPGGDDIVIGNDDDPGGVGFIGQIQNVIMGIGDLSVAEEAALYAGIAPTGANAPTDYWYIDEGTGTAITSYGSQANPGTADAVGTDWETATFTAGSTGRLCDFYIEVDDGVLDPDRWGANLKGTSVDDNNNDWEFFLNDCMPYVKSLDMTVSGVTHGSYDLTKYLPTSNVIDRSYYGLDFDGVNDLVTITDDPSLNITDTITIETWVNMSVAGWACISKWTDYALRVDAASDTFDAILWGVYTFNATIDLNTWYHIVVTYDGANVRGYLDGILIDTHPNVAAIPTGASDLLIGRSLGSGWITGDIDEVRIYNRAIDQTEIDYSHNGGIGRYTPYDTTGLVLELHIEEGVGVATADTSGEGNNGTITGATWVNGKVPRPVDSSGTNDGTASFRTTSSDADVIATAVSFVPIEEAKAPTWTLDTTVATWVTAPVITGNFTTTPGPTFPGASVISDIAAASGTPAQLPFTILFGFIVLALSLIVTYLMRQSSAGSLLVKFLVIAFAMWIGIVLNVVDFWMMLFFIFMALAILSASKQGALV